jgi:beta-lactamase class A
MHKHIHLLIFSAFILTATSAQKPSLKKLKKEITSAFSQQTGVFALAFKDLQTGKTLFINEHEIFHAASTMKTPVLIEAYKQAAEGRLAITDSITIINEFKSIADTSHFTLSAADDSEFELYKHIGEKATLYYLLYQMIISSSNLATNIVIDKLGATNVTATLRSLGANDIKVLRGVEDGKAYEKGLNNVVSAYDLALLFEKMANGKIVSQDASQAMIKILLDQQFKDIIPAKLPAGVKVAHKTGFIAGIHHDSGIVFLPDGEKYVLVLLSKNLTDDKAGIEAMANVSEMIYKYVSGDSKK